MNIQRPIIQPMPLADGLRWSGNASLFQEKSDGVWYPLEWCGHWFNAERMRGGNYVINDLISINGQDIRLEPLTARWRALRDIAATFPAGMTLCRTGSGGEFLEAILRDGGEGIVAKPWDAPFASGWLKCKRIETYDVVVSDTTGDKLSVAIAFEGQPAGRVPVRDVAILTSLRAGDVIEIAAQDRHPSGKFREPRFVRVRNDKGGSR